jgi:hypothetical protein
MHIAHNTKQFNSTYNYIMLAYYQYIEKGLYNLILKLFPILF